MTKATSIYFERNLEAIRDAKEHKEHSIRCSEAYGIIKGLLNEECINEDEFAMLKRRIDRACDQYWDKAKADFESAHKRIF